MSNLAPGINYEARESKSSSQLQDIFTVSYSHLDSIPSSLKGKPGYLSHTATL